MAKIAIVGVGAIGSVAAALLEKAGHEVVLCVRRPLPELVVESPAGALTVHGRRLTDAAQATAVEGILVATKAYDVPAVAPWLARLGASGCPVAVLQNGVEHRERLAPYVEAPRVVPVVVECPVERSEPARVRQRGPMHLTSPDTDVGRWFAALFAGSGATTVTTPDFATAAWRKLCLNAAGVLPALLLRPNEVFQDDAVADAGREIVRECIAVGRAEGAVLEEGLSEAVIGRVRAGPRDSVNSLLADRLAGRATEIDARNGVIVRFGRRHSIPTPCNQLAVALIGAAR